MDRNNPEWWENAISWIRGNGGTVHPAISFSKTRELILIDDVGHGTTLIELPPECIPSVSAIQVKGVGKIFWDCICNLNGMLYNEEHDILIALMLAYQKENNDSELTECYNYRPYLDTLPKSESFNALPRRWSKEDLDLLEGSNLLNRIDRAKHGVKNDYNLISKSWSIGDQLVLPTFENFDNMLAVVTSRGFAGMGHSSNDKDIGLLPLVDLCNHHRGAELALAKNASYTKHGSKVRLTSCDSLQKGTVIRLTYGAKGNAQLLLNYGFTIQKNIEQDGSSNDVVEVKLNNDCPLVDLRTGPKSYSFGCFSRAVEQFHLEGEACVDLGRPPANFDEFMNDCDENFDDFEMECDIKEEMQEEENHIEAEINAIKKLEKCLANTTSKYSLRNKQLEELLKNDFMEQRVQKKYAAILIHAELRTIQFYRLSCRLILERLQEEETSEFDWGISLEKEDEIRLREQAVELCEVFIKIRSLQ